MTLPGSRVRLLRSGTIDGLRVEQLGEHLWRNLYQEAAAAAVDVDGGQFENRALGINRQVFARTEGRSAADLIAGVAFRGFGFARLDLLCADLPGKIFQAYLTVAMHQDDERLGVLILHDQSLHHGVLIRAKLPRRFAGPAMLDVVVEVHGEADIIFSKKRRGRSFRGVL